jgi:inorganic phosphate transporter, PiT family
MFFHDPLLVSAVACTLAFAFLNGFDGGSVIATLVCSRAMRPRKALALATLAEFIGPLVLGTAVAQTVACSVLKPEVLQQIPKQTVYIMITAATCSAILWSITTWLLKLPSSSSHALFGGLIGAGIACAGTSVVSIEKFIERVLLPLFASPIIGIAAGYFIFSAVRGLSGSISRRFGWVFVTLQKPSTLFLAAGHGSNDAQKSMGIISLVLSAGQQNIGTGLIPEWVVICCSASLALGLAIGGWRIVRSLGYGICRMEPVHSFSAQLATTSVLIAASVAGSPVSTAQVMSSSVIGVGAARRLSGVRWSMALNIIYAWMLTIPISAFIGALLCLGIAAVVSGQIGAY